MAWPWWSCIFSIKERKPGWYKWTLAGHRAPLRATPWAGSQLANDDEPTCRFIEDAVAVRFNGDTEYMAVVPDGFEECEVDTDDNSSYVVILSNEYMLND